MSLILAVVSAGRASTLRLELETVWNGTPILASSPELTNAAGEMLKVSRLAFLASGFRLRSEAGGWTNLSPDVAYFSPLEGGAGLDWTNAPVGDFLALQFRVGLDPERNHAAVDGFAPAHPLNPLVNGLHWNWQGGFVFLALEGRHLTSDREWGGFSFHLATDRMATTVDVPGAFSLRDDAILHVQFDLARVFDAVTVVRLGLPGGDSTHSAGGDALADRLKANLARAWRFDRVEVSPGQRAAEQASQASKAAPTAKLRPWRQPAGFPRPKLPADNPLTEEGVALGDRLFHDPALSGNGRQSCADCHHEKAGFADPGRMVSSGAAGAPGRRNTPALGNLAWQSAFFWDGRAARLRDQVLQPISNPVEMAGSMEQAVLRISAAQGYAEQFAAAFGGPDITAERLSLALEQYLLTLVDADARFDRAQRGEAVLTQEERRGFELFSTEYDPPRGKYGADCFHCHGGPLFSDFRFHDNGLAAADGVDPGRAEVTGNPADTGKFKTPSLRNVAVTGPYMHDGRFATLAEVVAHYDHGVRRGGNLDPNLAKHPTAGLGLGDADQRALVAFLGTLTEHGCEPPARSAQAP